MRHRLAFGVEPARTAYSLRLARYEAAASAIAEFVREKRTAEPERTFAVLDVGVGNGRTLRYLEPHAEVEALRFFGIDSSERRLAHLHNRRRWELVRGDVEEGLPYSDASFDVVVCEQVMEHLDHPKDLVREIARTLRPGGLFIAGVPVFPPGVDVVRKRLGPAWDRLRRVDRSHVQTFTVGSFVRLICGDGSFRLHRARGFRMVSGGPLRPLENCRWWWRLNRKLGSWVPWFCIEVQVLARRQPQQPPRSTEDAKNGDAAHEDAQPDVRARSPGE